MVLPVCEHTATVDSGYAQHRTSISFSDPSALRHLRDDAARGCAVKIRAGLEAVEHWSRVHVEVRTVSCPAFLFQGNTKMVLKVQRQVRL